MSVILNSPNVVIGHMSGGTININNIASSETAKKKQPVCEDIEPIQSQEDVNKYCEYICRERLREQGLYSLDEFEKMLANAAKEPAPQFAKFLNRYKQQGNLDFLGHTKRQIFDNFRKHFPQMREYDYSNFAAAF